jgi:hypothetical protein
MQIALTDRESDLMDILWERGASTVTLKGDASLTQGDAATVTGEHWHWIPTPLVSADSGAEFGNRP